MDKVDVSCLGEALVTAIKEFGHPPGYTIEEMNRAMDAVARMNTRDVNLIDE